MKKICVIGGGRWGQNHIKTLTEMGNLAAIADANPARLKELLNLYPGVQGFNEVEQAIDANFDGYIVATPAETHYLIGKKLLGKGQNVLIEKPMTLKSEQSKELIEIAKKTGSQLMVGHILLFHPAIRKIKEVMESGKIGDLHYIYSTRLNLGTVRTEENVFWSFAPHDISVLDYLIGKSAVKIDAKGSKFLQDKIFDVTMTQFEFPDNVHAHIFVSWLHPFKEQRLVVIGSKGMLSFDDSSKSKDILYYNKHIDFVEGLPVKVEEPDEIILYDRKAPLKEELTYFIEHLDKPITIAGGESGYEVVKVLEQVQFIIDQ
ncbi:MAG: Gfo/Idh/MocA family oxidoreductase [Bacteroidales bacterium]|jgi:UDP-2-acetamido-3-amino-2,3-dideoxy-glucuronate N-acetyltransferase|nr:Gfo/Idh/MocA family oxidoreductase [Bacteroidales bacterium]